MAPTKNQVGVSFVGLNQPHMVTTLDSFQQHRRDLIRSAEYLARIGEELRSRQLVLSARSVLHKLEEFSFNLVILGKFKRGKSTLINALLGAKLLPTSTIPLTSIPTVVRFGPVARMRILFSNEDELESDIGRIEQYVTEQGNPGNKEGVALVEVEYPADILRDGLRIVDTPGTGTVYFHNKDGTHHKLLPEADAAIFVFAADHPASRAELNYIHNCQKFAKRFFFVQNKTDIVANDEEINESLNFLREALARELGENLMVYPVSAKLAMEVRSTESLSERININGLRQLEDDLIYYLANDRAAAFIETCSKRLDSLAITAEELLELELRSASTPAEALWASLVKFREVAAKISGQQKEACHIARGEITLLVGELDEDLKPVVKNNKAPLVRWVRRTFTQRQHTAKSDLIHILRIALTERVEDIFNNWRQHEDVKIEEALDRITNRFVEHCNQIVERIRQVTREIFAIGVTTNFDLEPLTHDSQHYYAVDDLLALSIETIPLLLPEQLAKRVIRARFIRAAGADLSTNSAKLKAEYQERLQTSTNRFLTNFQAQVSEALTQIEDAVARALEQNKASSSKRNAAQMRILERLETLREIRTKLDQKEARLASGAKSHEHN
jgi:GTPase SAR1 family protein